MINTNNLNPLKNFKNDIPASIVVFLVALPLCLGIASASEAPPFAGIIAGIVGGIIVGLLSGSPLGVSGPAAGLAVIVAGAIGNLGGFDNFLVAVVLAGIIQLTLGFLKAGFIAYYFPSSVIHGMLAGIGIQIFFKQLPHAFGIDRDPEGDLEFFQKDNENTFSEILNIFSDLNTGVVIVTAVSLAILLLWQLKFISKSKISKIIPGPFLAVIAGIVLTKVFSTIPELAIHKDHLVQLSTSEDSKGFFSNFTLPNINALSNPKIYIMAGIIALVASLETLLCVEASDKQDPYKRITPTNRELKAQGVGNIVSGLIGGLPVTQVIVRSSANVQSGGKTKSSTIIHGILILVSIIAFPSILDLIPYGTLAAILFVVGFKLAKPALFKRMFKQGWGQFLPFIVTIVAMILTDLLIGIGLGLVVAIIIILRNNFKTPYKLIKEEVEENHVMRINLSQDVTFLNKASIQNTFEQVPDNTHVIIDASNTNFIHFDVLEIIEDFKINAMNRGIKLEFIELYEHKQENPLEHFELTNNDKKK